MDEKNFVDVSSFMLFEATGDSEADSHELNMASGGASYGMDVEPDYGNYDEDDDDAESCIYDLLESKPILELRDPRVPRHHYGDHNDGGDDEKRVIDQDWANDDDDDTGNSHDDQDPLHVDDGDDDDEDEVVMKSTAKRRQHKKARVCVDSTMGLLNEMEKSRLFWEACLAS